MICYIFTLPTCMSLLGCRRLQKYFWNEICTNEFCYRLHLWVYVTRLTKGSLMKFSARKIAHIAQNVNWGWIIHNSHINGTLFFLLCIYIHTTSKSTPIQFGHRTWKKCLIFVSNLDHSLGVLTNCGGAFIASQNYCCLAVGIKCIW